MRLTTLARKIDKTPTQLIAYLEENGIPVAKGVHGKLDEETVEKVLNDFMPDQQEVIMQEPAVDKEEEVAEASRDLSTETEQIVEEKDSEADESTSNMGDDVMAVPELPNEVQLLKIRPQKPVQSKIWKMKIPMISI